MNFSIYPKSLKTGMPSVFTQDVDAANVWDAIETWLESLDEELFREFSDTIFVVTWDGGFGRREFQVVEQNSDFYAEPVDGRGLLKPPDETFHLGLSCYGPTRKGNFRGAISVDGVTLYSRGGFESLEAAREAAMGKLLEFTTRTLGFSRKDAIDEISKEASHGRHTDRDAGPALDGQELPGQGTGGG